MAAAAAMGDLFAPGFNRSDPNSVAAQQNWQSRNFALTPDMIEQTRSPSTTRATGKFASLGVPAMETVRGSVDPEALKIYAQGGKYDFNARRNAIAAAMQPAAAPAASGGGGGYDPYAAYRSAMASRGGGGGGGGLTGLGGLGGGGGGGDPYAAYRSAMASRAQPAAGWGGGSGAFSRGGGDPHAGMHYDPSTPIGGDPWKAGPGKSGWEELAAAQAQLEADPYGQYFGNKAQISGSATETGWMNALQPWQGGVSVGGQPGSGINTSGFIGGGTMMHADPAYWGYGTADPAALWREVQQTNPALFDRLGGQGGMAEGLAAGVGPSGAPASGFGGSVGGAVGGGSVGGGSSGDSIGGSTGGRGGGASEGYSPGYGSYGGDAYGYSSTGENVAQGSIGPSGYGGAFGGTQSGYGYQGDAPAAFGGGLGQPGFGNTANSTMGISGYGTATIGSPSDAYGNDTWGGATPGTFGGDFGGGVSQGWGGFGFGPGVGDMGDEGYGGQGESY